MAMADFAYFIVPCAMVTLKTKALTPSAHA